MLKLTSLLATLTAWVTLTASINAAPFLAERSPPSLRCSPPSMWNNGSLSLNAEYSNPGPILGVRVFTNETTGRQESRVSVYKENQANMRLLDVVSGEYCNSTTFNYTYQFPEQDFYEKNEPLRIRTPEFGRPSGYGYDYPTCVGIGTSYDTPRDAHTGKLPITGTYPVSIQECSNTDFDQIASTQAQLFQLRWKYNYIITTNGYASGQNPDEGLTLVIDKESGDVLATSNRPDPNPGSEQAFYIGFDD